MLEPFGPGPEPPAPTLTRALGPAPGPMALGPHGPWALYMGVLWPSSLLVWPYYPLVSRQDAPYPRFTCFNRFGNCFGALSPKALKSGRQKPGIWLESDVRYFLQDGMEWRGGYYLGLVGWPGRMERSLQKITLSMGQFLNLTSALASLGEEFILPNVPGCKEVFPSRENRPGY